MIGLLVSSTIGNRPGDLFLKTWFFKTACFGHKMRNKRKISSFVTSSETKKKIYSNFFKAFGHSMQLSRPCINNWVSITSLQW